jgi:hypothetical protein
MPPKPVAGFSAPLVQRLHTPLAAYSAASSGPAGRRDSHSKTPSKDSIGQSFDCIGRRREVLAWATPIDGGTNVCTP